MLDKLQAIEERFERLGEEFLGVGSDYQRAAEINKERVDLEPLIGKSRQYRQAMKSFEEAKSIIVTENDAELIALAKADVEELTPKIEVLEREIRGLLVPKDPRDDKNVIVEIRAGAGGDEAAIFAADLFRMYTRYAETKRWKTELLSESSIGVGGFKEIIFELKGKGAYSRLKYESGVHRVQRVHVTEAGGRLHTSTATVAVLPEAEDVEVNIAEEDLRVDIFHASGHGGQNVQKVATAVRLIHLPTGLVVTCQDERSQLKNRMKAMAVLRARLLRLEQEKQDAQITQTRRSQVGTGERSEKIRTYNFPQDRITDHRISVSWHNLPGILDGELDPMIDAVATADQAEGFQQALVAPAEAARK